METSTELTTETVADKGLIPIMLSSDPLFKHLQLLFCSNWPKEESQCLWLGTNVAMVLRYLYGHDLEPSKVSLSLSAIQVERPEDEEIEDKSGEDRGDENEEASWGPGGEADENSTRYNFIVVVAVHEGVGEMTVVIERSVESSKDALDALHNEVDEIMHWLVNNSRYNKAMLWKI